MASLLSPAHPPFPAHPEPNANHLGPVATSIASFHRLPRARPSAAREESKGARGLGTAPVSRHCRINAPFDSLAPLAAQGNRIGGVERLVSAGFRPQ